MPNSDVISQVRLKDYREGWAVRGGGGRSGDGRKEVEPIVDAMVHGDDHGYVGGNFGGHVGGDAGRDDDEDDRKLFKNTALTGEKR